MSNEPVDSHLFVVLGGHGDLMFRKLLPALYRLFIHGHIPNGFCVLGAARSTALDDVQIQTQAREALREIPTDDPEQLDRFCDRVYYQSIGGERGYEDLAARITELESAHGLPGNRVFYLALPPAAFPPSIESMGRVGLNRSPGWTRLVIEKPFGRDLSSAQELNRLVHRYFDEGSVYRIDHYLGKETVQNLLVFRFANPLFEHTWNRDRVERVEITVAEKLGLEGRAGYYDQAGALRDMIQNHLTQLLTLTAMELPASFQPEAIRDEKVKVLQAIRPIPPEHVVFGQYAAGNVDGQAVPAYLDEPGVAPHSVTETFAALRLEISNWRWQGVPFYLRTGKHLPRKVSQIVVTFRRPPVACFKPLCTRPVDPNELVITIQPDEGFDVHFQVKAPGAEFGLQTQSLRFRYSEVHGALPEAYETLLLDVMVGDATLFVRADEVEAAWSLYTPLLERRPPIYAYQPGSWGPNAAMRLLNWEEGWHWSTR
ncbi:MAG: glucose-6-phosphate dehydrogenase [Mycobacterium leprae]